MTETRTRTRIRTKETVTKDGKAKIIFEVADHDESFSVSDKDAVEGLTVRSERDISMEVKALLEKTVALKRLKLEFWCIDKPVSELEEWLHNNQTLEEVDLMGLEKWSEPRHEDWCKLLVALATCPKLKRVQIEFAVCLGTPNVEEGRTIGDAMALLCTSRKLENLTLKKCPFMPPKLQSSMFENLKACTSLKHLTLESEWRIRKPQVVTSIAALLKASRSIETLSIPLKITSATPIAQALYTNRSLRRLELRDGEYDCAVGRFYSAMGKSLEHNCILSDLIIGEKDVLSFSDCLGKKPDFEHNGGAVYRKLILYLRLNQAGREDLLLGKKSDREVLETIIANKEDTDMTFCFLMLGQSFLIRQLAPSWNQSQEISL